MIDYKDRLDKLTRKNVKNARVEVPVRKLKQNLTGTKKIIKIIRDTIAGLLGGGAGFALTGDLETALLIGVSALLLAIGVDFEIVKKLKELFSEKKK